MSEKWDIYADWNPLISVLVVTLSPRQRIHPIGKKAIITIEAESKK